GNFYRARSTEADDRTAITHYQEAIRIDPQYASAHAALSTTWTMLAGVLLEWADFDWRGAEAEFRRALQLAPNDSQAMSWLAGLSASLGQPERAVELKRRALDRDPLHATWFETLATYYSALERLDDAQRAIEKAIALQPNGASFHQTLAVIAIQRGDAQAALHAAQQGPA